MGILQLTFYFLLFSIAGWIMETILCSIEEKKFINRGFLKGPWCPIYGTGALVIIYTNEILMTSLRFKDKNIVTIFLVAMISASILEYFTSWAMEKLFHMRWWDYTGRFLNINGRVCFTNAIAFGIMGLLVYYYIYPRMKNEIPWWNNPPLYAKVGVIVIAAVFLTDLTTTLINYFHLRKKFTDFVDELSEKGEKIRLTGKEDLETLIAKVREDREKRKLEFLDTLKNRANIFRRLMRNYPDSLAKHIASKNEEGKVTTDKE